MRPIHVTVLSLLLVVPINVSGQYRRLLVSGLFADSSIAGPFLRYTFNESPSSEYALTLMGWTIDGQWIKHQSDRRAFVIGAEITPVNAHASDRIYVDGERVHDLEYEASSYRLRGGFRLAPNSRSLTDIQLVGLVENVQETHDPALESFWDEPFVGIEFAHTYKLISSDRPLVSSFDGWSVGVRVEAFTGSETWSRATLTQRGGMQAGKFHLRESLMAATGKSLNTVNRFLIGGSWDALGESALHGFKYNEFRVARAVAANIGADYELPRNWRIGVRGSHLRSDVANVSGAALNASKIWKTFGVNMGVGVPQERGGESDVVLYVAVIAPLYAK